MLSSRYSQEDEAFRAVLRNKRKEAGLNQVALAKKLGTTQSTISKMERGELRLDVIDFIHVCDALGVRPAAILEEVFGR